MGGNGVISKRAVGIKLVDGPAKLQLAILIRRISGS